MNMCMCTCALCVCPCMCICSVHVHVHCAYSIHHNLLDLEASPSKISRFEPDAIT